MTVTRKVISVADARIVSKSLRTLGFEVTYMTSSNWIDKYGDILFGGSGVSVEIPPRGEAVIFDECRMKPHGPVVIWVFGSGDATGVYER